MTQVGLSCTIDGAESTSSAPSPATAQSFDAESWLPLKIGIEASPDHIEQGISCGMSWMCGEHPCLCGIPDQWGDCACNGTESVPCDIQVEATGDVAVFSLGGSWYALPLRPGGGDITVTASLPHYETTQAVLHLEAGPVSAAAAGGIVVVAALVATAIATAARSAAKRARRSGDVPDNGSGDAPDDVPRNPGERP